MTQGKHDDKNQGKKTGAALGRREVMKGIALAGVAGLPTLMAQTPAMAANQTHSYEVRSPRVEQWGLQEITLHSGKKYGNPFQDVQLHCTFASGSVTKRVKGFFDGASTWKVRFMPETRGHWTFQTSSNDSSLDGKKGEFEVTAPAEGNHGPVGVAKQFHFSYADGTPFYALGTTTYEIFQQSREATLRAFSTLSGTAFNKVRLFVMPPSSRRPGPTPFQRTGSSGFDFDRYDVDFYRRYEAGLQDLQALGIEADLILLNPYDFRGKFSSLPQPQDEAYIQYTAARLSAYRNVWWTLTNEFDLYPQFGIHKNWRQLGELLASSDPYGHLRGIHNSCVGFYDNSQAWIDHVILQDITLQRLAADPRNDSAMELNARKIGKPVMVDEYGYEGNIATSWGSLSPREELQMHWSIVMGGAYGSHGETYFGTPKGALVGEAPVRLAFLKKIMTEVSFQDLEPLNDIMSGEYPSVTVLGTPGVCYLFHFAQPKQKSTWNTGFFGPATPDHPLPITNRHLSPEILNEHENLPAPKFNIEDGVYRVEVIDTWQMKVHQVGLTSGAAHQFHSPIEPGIVRLTRVKDAPLGEHVLPIKQLIRNYSSTGSSDL